MADWTELPRPIVALAPMADFTDSAFCRLCRRFGAQIVFHEMVSAEALIRNSVRTLRMTAFDAEERPVIQQVFGSNPASVTESIRIIDEEYGPDGFDINMGCPARKIAGNFNGAALMREPAKAAAIIRAAKTATVKPVSVKTRLGWSRPDEILEFVKVIEDAGADLVTIHGRTKEQGYSGQANWEMIGRAKTLVKIPVLLNGDVVGGASARRALEISGCDGLLVGRAALGNPWVFPEIVASLNEEPWSPPSRAEMDALVLEHARMHSDLHQETKPLVTFRKHLGSYYKGVPGAKRLREELMRVETLEELEKIIS
jgi:nifR3 family TIM-barrel protein